MRRSVLMTAPLAALAAAAAGFAFWRDPAPEPLPLMEAEAFAALYAEPLAPPTGPMATYHLGHSLVGRDMPAMLAQLAGHDHASQLGWGASLRQHWEPGEEIPGFATENAHGRHKPAEAALDSGSYQAVVLTEMVEIRAAIRWHDSARYLARWAARARRANPEVRVYLYETWHRLDDEEGWLERIDADLQRHWQDDLLRPALTQPGVAPVHLIPGGQVMAAAVRAIEAGQVPGLASRTDLFTRKPDGTVDEIHINDLGAYLIALTHYSVLYHQSPEGLPHRLVRADGSEADALPEAAVLPLQRLVWQVVRGNLQTGIAPLPGQ